jgi:hypothetical protein
MGDVYQFRFNPGSKLRLIKGNEQIKLSSFEGDKLPGQYLSFLNDKVTPCKPFHLSDGTINYSFKQTSENEFVVKEWGIFGSAKFETKFNIRGGRLSYARSRDITSDDTVHCVNTKFPDPGPLNRIFSKCLELADPR